MKNRKLNYVFAICCCISLVFLIAPVLLRFPFIRRVVSLFLDSLEYTDYKIAYIETLGSILGTATAISGALWTQKQIDKVANQKEIEQSASVVYYELKFALNNVRLLLTYYCLEANEPSIDPFNINESAFAKITKFFQLHISDDWNKHISILSSVLSSSEIGRLVALYNDLCGINLVLNPFLDSIPDERIRRTFGHFNSITQIKTIGRIPGFEVYLTSEIEDLLEKLKTIASIVDDDKSNE